ncbi:HAD family hydrolase [Desulfotruncus alcoholivorax]|uniref:HAD family hydrolase n=1 Tax=Desulfotruncus alcoholivorax TaxID=265477 RepID=UPI001EE629E5|nr:HAD family hydrolase [Desulfotruncus alcoholivorax]
MKAVLFDLDGTLLQLDTQEFMNIYLKEVAGVAIPLVEPQRFTTALLSSTYRMLHDRDPQRTNSEVFWADFSNRLSDCIDSLTPLIESFYAEQFRNLSWVAKPSESARKAVLAALNKGARIVLATNPVFPRSAVMDRMAWAGVDDLPWEFVTSYEDMHFCKPYQEYYSEIISRLKLNPQECLMVGNDVGKDMVAGYLGFRTYLVTDHLIDNGQSAIKPDWAGKLDELAGWLAETDIF